MSSRAVRKTRIKNKITEGIVHIKATFNNTLIVITDNSGNKIAQASAGSEGFKGARKSTPFAAQTAAEELAKRLKNECGLTRVCVKVRGPGAGREPAIRGVRNGGFNVYRVEDKTRLPHNGCRPRKKRRV